MDFIGLFWNNADFKRLLSCLISVATDFLFRKKMAALFWGVIEVTLRIMGSQNWCFENPRTLVYTRSNPSIGGSQLILRVHEFQVDVLPFRFISNVRFQLASLKLPASLPLENRSKLATKREINHPFSGVENSLLVFQAGYLSLFVGHL